MIIFFTPIDNFQLLIFFTFGIGVVDATLYALVSTVLVMAVF